MPSDEQSQQMTDAEHRKLEEGLRLVEGERVYWQGRAREMRNVPSMLRCHERAAAFEAVAALVRRELARRPDEGQEG